MQIDGHTDEAILTGHLQGCESASRTIPSSGGRLSSRYEASQNCARTRRRPDTEGGRQLAEHLLSSDEFGIGLAAKYSTTLWRSVLLLFPGLSGARIN